jgi:hypothetical protein
MSIISLFMTQISIYLQLLYLSFSIKTKCILKMQYEPILMIEQMGPKQFAILNSKRQ